MAKKRTGDAQLKLMRKIVEVKHIKIMRSGTHKIDVGQIIINSSKLSKIDKVKVYVYKIPKSVKNLEKQ